MEKDILIIVHGDESVGIQDINIKISGMYIDSSDIEFVRSELEIAFSNIYDALCTVYMDSEEIYTL